LVRGLAQPCLKAALPLREGELADIGDDPTEEVRASRQIVKVTLVDDFGCQGDRVFSTGLQVRYPQIEREGIVRPQKLNAFHSETRGLRIRHDVFLGRQLAPPGKISLPMKRMNFRSLVVIGMPFWRQYFCG
jgi:hypothetical protein